MFLVKIMVIYSKSTLGEKNMLEFFFNNGAVQASLTSEVVACATTMPVGGRVGSIKQKQRETINQVKEERII